MSVSNTVVLGVYGSGVLFGVFAALLMLRKGLRKSTPLRKLFFLGSSGGGLFTAALALLAYGEVTSAGTPTLFEIAGAIGIIIGMVIPFYGMMRAEALIEQRTDRPAD